MKGAALGHDPLPPLWCMQPTCGNFLILRSSQAVNAPLMETYDSYASEKQIGGQLLLQTYKVNPIALPGAI